jgi:nicotinate-nucleotide pyrophosphorylase (carboxylating)
MRQPEPLDERRLARLAKAALREDRAHRDITTAALVTAGQRGRGILVAKAQGIVAGLDMCRAVFLAADATLTFAPMVDDGAGVVPGRHVARVEGALDPILRAERVALNYLQHLSGVTTLTRRFVEALAGSGCRLRDTRKTIPGLRALEKYAVLVGGGSNHRMDLAQGVLIKDNHLAALRARGLGLAVAMRHARQANPRLPIEVEVTTVTEAREALAAGADELLLDNMPIEAMRKVAAFVKGKAVLEASGGITLANVRDIAATGVDSVSVGAITHSAPALDISLEVGAL